MTTHKQISSIEKSRRFLLADTKTNVDKGDSHLDQAETCLQLAGWSLLKLRATYPRGQARDFYRIVRKTIGLGERRAQELMEIAKGKKTPKEARACKAEAMRKSRANRKSAPRYAEIRLDRKEADLVMKIKAKADRPGTEAEGKAFAAKLETIAEKHGCSVDELSDAAELMSTVGDDEAQSFAPKHEIPVTLEDFKILVDRQYIKLDIEDFKMWVATYMLKILQEGMDE